MKPKLTQKLLNKAGRLAKEMASVQNELTDAFCARYGTTYSDVDADSIIDVLDYSGGHITLAECDNIMTECGFPPITTNSQTG